MPHNLQTLAKLLLFLSSYLHMLAFCGIMLSNNSKSIANACYHLHRWAIMCRPLRKGQPMDIEEFEKRVQPSAKRSRLEPFRSQIFELKAKGYADWQRSFGIQRARFAICFFLDPWPWNLE